MHRRTLIRWMLSGAAVWPLRGVYLDAQAASLSDGSVATLRAVAPAVLPSELGAAGHQKAVADFVRWLATYRSGAERSWGYGHPRRTETPGIDPAVYDAQLRDLEQQASPKAASFSALPLDARRAIAVAVLESHGVRSLPGTPEGRHILLDFMGFYFTSGDATDLCYRARVAPVTCRGLAGAGNRPARLQAV